MVPEARSVRTVPGPGASLELGSTRSPGAYIGVHHTSMETTRTLGLLEYGAQGLAKRVKLQVPA
jgi:hypothetical protein